MNENIEDNIPNRNLVLLLAADNGLEINIVGHIAERLVNPLPLGALELHERNLRPRNEQFYEITIPMFNDDLFIEHFRMSRRSCQVLVNIVGNLRNNIRDHIQISKKVLFTIWVLDKQESFLAAGDFAKSTAHCIFEEIINVLAGLLPQYVMFPNAMPWAESARVFCDRSHGITVVVGAIDGCHIPCKQPQGNAHDYYNRKGFHSIILQGTCDHKGRFIVCFIGMPGRMHDARVLRSSPLFHRLTDEANPLLPENFHIIGDSAYPLLKNLMCPYRDNGHLTQEQIRYNSRLSTIRSIIERVFGMLKGKFRRLKYLDISNLELGNKIIAAACILHNFLIDQGDLNMNEDIVLDEHRAHENFNYFEDNPINEAVAKRNAIAALL